MRPSLFRRPQPLRGNRPQRPLPAAATRTKAGCSRGQRLRVSAAYGSEWSTPLDAYVTLGLAHCFEKSDDGKLEDRYLIEPITANSLECMANGAKTCYQHVFSLTLGDALQRSKAALPKEFAAGMFCEEFEARADAAARTWMRPHALDNLLDIVPLGQVKSAFNYSTDDKRVINFENVVSDSDNIKQDISIDADDYAEHEGVAAPAAAEEEEEDELDKLLAVPPSQLILSDVTPATRLLDKRRQQFEVDEALDAAKKEYESKEAAFKEREEALKRKDLELQESLLRFTHFLQENDAKRAKAHKRAADEVRARQEKEAEIAALHAEAESLGAQKDSIQQQLAKVARHQQYLQSVVEAGDAFQEVDDILTRHATLEAANADLQAQQAACAAEAERTRAATAEYAAARNHEVLDLHNRLGTLKRQLEALQGEAAALEAAHEYGLRAAAAKVLEQGQLGLATANLYQRVLAKSRLARAADEASPLAQLEAIGCFVSDMREVLCQHGLLGAG
eukprot:scaffold8.g1490.t1